MKKQMVRAALNKIARKNKPAMGYTVVKQMTGNPNFPGSETTTILDDVTKASDQLQAANEAAVNRDKEAVAVANEKALVWDAGMQAVVLYVQGKANADPLNSKSIILSAGLEVRKTPSPQPTPEAAKSVDAIFTNEPGRILVTWKMPKFATQSFVYMTSTPDVENSWVLVNSIQGRKLMVENLASNKRYYFRVVVANRRNEASAPSEIASTVAA